MTLEGIAREYYEIKEEIRRLERRRQELRETIFNTFSARNTDEIYAGDIRVYRVNRPKLSWEETELKSVLFAKGLWDEVVTVDNQKLKNLIETGKISEAEIVNCERESDRWFIYAERKVGSIRIKDLQKGVRFSELDAKVIDKGELRQGVSKFGKNWKLNHLSIEDKTGSIKLVLWNENTKIAEDINVGDRIVVKNGYVSEYVRGDDRELQISLRKDSDVVVIGAKEEMEDLEEKAEDLEEDEEEIEEAIEGGYAYEVYEGYKEDSWRGKS
ncbi:MAG: OB-fold nucleic acid binding domain-containing protein [archaeon]|nr:OB-fold nucleic acid binding domain-containing protein [archaeon]